MPKIQPCSVRLRNIGAYSADLQNATTFRLHETDAALNIGVYGDVENATSIALKTDAAPNFDAQNSTTLTCAVDLKDGMELEGQARELDDRARRKPGRPRKERKQISPEKLPMHVPESPECENSEIKMETKWESDYRDWLDVRSARRKPGRPRKKRKANSQEDFSLHDSMSDSDWIPESCKNERTTKPESGYQACWNEKLKRKPGRPRKNNDVPVNQKNFSIQGAGSFGNPKAKMKTDLEKREQPGSERKVKHGRPKTLWNRIQEEKFCTTSGGDVIRIRPAFHSMKVR